MIVVGGALRTARDYLPLAGALAHHACTVHVVDRRGRGASGPQGPHYTLRSEAEDLLAVQAETGARLVFGHSYGGLAVLETARLSPVFDRIAVYEPGVPVGPVPSAWIRPGRRPPRGGLSPGGAPQPAVATVLQDNVAVTRDGGSASAGIAASPSASIPAGQVQVPMAGHRISGPQPGARLRRFDMSGRRRPYERGGFVYLRLNISLDQSWHTGKHRHYQRSLPGV